MHELLERLGRGDERLVGMCREANRVWREFFTELDGCDTGTMSARLGFLQSTFHRIFESPSLGEAMMPWSGFATLYDTKDKWATNLFRARQLAEAFAQSHCSRDVCEEARACVMSYELEPMRGVSAAKR